MKTSRFIPPVFFFALFFSSLLTVSGCNDKTRPTDVTTALRASLNAGDPTAAAKLFADDGVMLPGLGTSIKGQAAIAQYMEKTLRRQTQFWIDSETSMMSGDMAYDEGNYRIRDIRRSEDLDKGKYINVFKRVNGEWKIYRSIFSPNALSRASDTPNPPVQ